LAEDLLRLVPVQSPRAFVPRGDRALGIQGDDRVLGGGFQDRVQERDLIGFSRATVPLDSVGALLHGTSPPWKPKLDPGPESSAPRDRSNVSMAARSRRSSPSSRCRARSMAGAAHSPAARSSSSRQENVTRAPPIMPVAPASR